VQFVQKKTNETTKDNDTGDMIKMLQGTGIAEEAENETGALVLKVN
jgi:hypothetical protein